MPTCLHGRGRACRPAFLAAAAHPDDRQSRSQSIWLPRPLSYGLMERTGPMPRRGTIEGFTAVIPAGGIGSRLWPLSRADAPKFLHDLTGSGNSLLRDTWDRVVPLAGADRV